AEPGSSLTKRIWLHWEKVSGVHLRGVRKEQLFISMAIWVRVRPRSVAVSCGLLVIKALLRAQPIPWLNPTSLELALYITLIFIVWGMRKSWSIWVFATIPLATLFACLSGRSAAPVLFPRRIG